MYTMPEEDLEDLSFKQTDEIEMNTHMINKLSFAKVSITSKIGSDVK